MERIQKADDRRVLLETRRRAMLLGALLSFAVFSGTNAAYAAWTEPSAAPTGGNVAAPLNVSSLAQTKNGLLTLENGLVVSPDGSIIAFAGKGAIATLGKVAVQATPITAINVNYNYRLTAGVWGVGGQATTGAWGTSYSAGVYGVSSDSVGGGNHIGLLGAAAIDNLNSFGIYGISAGVNSYAGYFIGKVTIAGNLSSVPPIPGNLTVANDTQTGRLCMEDGVTPGNIVCKASWATIGGGTQIWARNGNNVYPANDPVTPANETNITNIAVGGPSSATAKFFFDVSNDDFKVSSGSITIGDPPPGPTMPGLAGVEGDHTCSPNESCGHPDCWGLNTSTCVLSQNKVCASDGTDTCVDVPENVANDTTSPDAPVLRSEGVTSDSASMAWGASADGGGSGLAGYELWRCIGSGCVPVQYLADIGTATSLKDEPLFSTTNYRYALKAFDHSGNISSLSNIIEVLTQHDTVAPTAPGNLRVDGTVTPNVVPVAWDGSTDTGGSGLAGYRVFRCAGEGCTPSAIIATTGVTTNFDDITVTQTTAYRYSVLALDGEGNQSAASNVISVTTPESPAVPDDQAPTVPGDFRLNGPVAIGNIPFTWNASTDNVGVVGYKVYRCLGSLTCTPEYYMDAGLTTTYVDVSRFAGNVRYQITAYDGAGNESGRTAELGVTVTFSPGCFVGSTRIQLADGTTKAIADMHEGDRVLAYDERTGTMQPGVVAQVLRHPEEPMYLLVNGFLKVTPIHRVLSVGVWRHIGNLKVGDTLTNAQGEAVPIISIVPIHEQVDVFNLSVAPYRTYVADGVVVHNIKDSIQSFLQKELQEPKPTGLATAANGKQPSIYSPAEKPVVAGVKPLMHLLAVPTAQAKAADLFTIPMAVAASGGPSQITSSGFERLTINQGTILLNFASGTSLEIGNNGADITSSGTTGANINIYANGASTAAIFHNIGGQTALYVPNEIKTGTSLCLPGAAPTGGCISTWNSSSLGGFQPADYIWDLNTPAKRGPFPGRGVYSQVAGVNLEGNIFNMSSLGVTPGNPGAYPDPGSSAFTFLVKQGVIGQATSVSIDTTDRLFYADVDTNVIGVGLNTPDASNNRVQISGANSPLRIECGGRRCLNINKTGGSGVFEYQSFRRGSAADSWSNNEKWRFLSNTTDDSFTIGTGSSNVLTLSQAGNVGINTTAPDVKLVIDSGTAGQSGLKLARLLSCSGALKTDASGSVICGTGGGGTVAGTSDNYLWNMANLPPDVTPGTRDQVQGKVVLSGGRVSGQTFTQASNGAFTYVFGVGARGLNDATGDFTTLNADHATGRVGVGTEYPNARLTLMPGGAYLTGTGTFSFATASNPTNQVVGSGTALFTTQLGVNKYLIRITTAPQYEARKIRKIIDNTHLELEFPFSANVASAPVRYYNIPPGNYYRTGSTNGMYSFNSNPIANPTFKVLNTTIPETKFTQDLEVGYYLVRTAASGLPPFELRKVKKIISDTELELETPFTVSLANYPLRYMPSLLSAFDYNNVERVTINPLGELCLKGALNPDPSCINDWSNMILNTGSGSPFAGQTQTTANFSIGGTGNINGSLSVGQVLATTAKIYTPASQPAALPNYIDAGGMIGGVNYTNRLVFGGNSVTVGSNFNYGIFESGDLTNPVLRLSEQVTAGPTLTHYARLGTVARPTKLCFYGSGLEECVDKKSDLAGGGNFIQNMFGTSTSPYVQANADVAVEGRVSSHVLGIYDNTGANPPTPNILYAVDNLNPGHDPKVGINQTAPNSMLTVTGLSTANSTGDVNNVASLYGNTTKSTLYAEQQGWTYTGGDYPYAGYFSGRVAMVGKKLTASWDDTTGKKGYALRVQGSQVGDAVQQVDGQTYGLIVNGGDIYGLATASNRTTGLKVSSGARYSGVADTYAIEAYLPTSVGSTSGSNYIFYGERTGITGGSFFGVKISAAGTGSYADYGGMFDVGGSIDAQNNPRSTGLWARAGNVNSMNDSVYGNIEWISPYESVGLYAESGNTGASDKGNTAGVVAIGGKINASGSGNSYGIWATSSSTINAWAGYFEGKVKVNGILETRKITESDTAGNNPHAVMSAFNSGATDCTTACTNLHGKNCILSITTVLPPAVPVVQSCSSSGICICGK